MQNLLHNLEQLFADKPEYMVDGKLIKNKVIEHALAMDGDLLGLLLSDPVIKEHFFVSVGKTLIFDKIKFQNFVSNKAFLPNSYTAYKNKIGLVDKRGDSFIHNKDVVLTWAYKDCVLEGGQDKEDAKRDEIFYNETLAPDDITRLYDAKVLTGFEKWDKESVKTNKAKPVTKFNRNEHGVITDNLLVKGNNLLALHTLKSEFANKVNLIYIDPPFNTGNDSFGYNDSFSRSTWLTFMRNRLIVARQLLAEDGNIFIHIDINQGHYLKVICDEIFDEKNFVEEIIWSYGSPSGGRAASAKPVNIHDYILHYAKNYSQRKANKVYIPYSQKYIEDWFKYTDEDGRRYQKRQRGKDSDGNAIWEKQYLDESKGVPLSTVWTDIKQIYADPRAYKDNQSAHTELIKEFVGGQKPEHLLKRIIEMCTDEGDLVLDYHAGTGTTLAAAHKMNRRWIGVEQLDYIKNMPEARLKTVIAGNQVGISEEVGWTGGGEFIYCTLMQWNEAFVPRILEATTEKDLQAIYNQMKEKAVLHYDFNPEEHGNLELSELPLEEQKAVLLELLNKNHLYVLQSEIDDKKFAVSEDDKKLNRDFFKKLYSEWNNK